MSASRALADAAERVLPRVAPSWHAPIAEAVGTIAYLAAPRARAAVRANLAVVAPDHPGLARRVFVNQVRGYLEVFQIPSVDAERLIAMVRVDGWDRFTRAHSRGKGVIFASAHLGPVSLVGQILMARGFELTLPVESTQSELMRAVNRARSARGLHLVPLDSPLGIHRALRHGGVLGFLADRAVSGVGIRVPFCGRQALVPSAHVALALRTGAALVPAFAWREGAVLHASIEEPLDLEGTGDRESDIREGVRRFVAMLERYVRRYPDQWTVFDRMWRD
jgi:Kdo2-lipid IVA lauroyltransferase/acyltransferase